MNSSYTGCFLLAARAGLRGAEDSAGQAPADLIAPGGLRVRLFIPRSKLTGRSERATVFFSVSFLRMIQERCSLSYF